MATRQDEGGSRLWRGMRHLLFGEDSEPTLRDEIEDAIDEAEESRPVAGDLSPLERQMLYARAEGQKLRQIGEFAGMDGRRVSEVISRAIKTLQRLCE